MDERAGLLIQRFRVRVPAEMISRQVALFFSCPPPPKSQSLTFTTPPRASEAKMTMTCHDIPLKS